MSMRLRFFLITVFSLIMTLFSTQKAQSAERINFVYSLLSFTVSIDSLEHFANTGELKPDLAQHTSSLDAKTLLEIRISLNKSFNFSDANLYKISRTSLGEDLLKQLGKVISTHKNLNGFYPIRGAILGANINYDSWTIIDVLREFPGREIFVDLELLAQLKDDIFAYQSYREAVIQAIKTVADESTSPSSDIDFEQMPDLSFQGNLEVEKQTVTIEQSQFRLTRDGFVGEYSFPVDFYVPVGQSPPLPLILISHGFGSVRENFTNMAQHLASYGFIVAVPQHIGSDLQYREELLKGTLSSALSPMEYLARPRDLSSIIDYLETTPEWQNRINFSAIGVIGDSLGGTTALSIAGAPLNIPRLRRQCATEQVIINTALILQCQGSHLPPLEYNLHDDRIKAVIATHPLTSGILGSESLAKISIPTMITAGSNDIVTPLVIEQIHPFLAVKNSAKHLVLYEPGTHFSSTQPAPEFTADYLPTFLVGKNRTITSQHFQGLAVAFMEVYLNNNRDYLTYLRSDYGNFISQQKDNLGVKQITNLTAENLQASYGGELPVEIEPTLALSDDSNQASSVVEEIRKNGILKVAYPQNNLPFGFIDEQGKWVGFCAFLADELAGYLEEKINLDFKPKVVFFPVSMNEQNTFDLVKSGQVHFLCGANKVSSNIEDISFSNPFFVTGYQFLIKQDNSGNFNPNQSLSQVKIGLFNNLSNPQFFAQKYPRSQGILFEGVNAMTDSLQALNNNEIQGIINDSIILQSQLEQMTNPDEYILTPDRPLSCTYYGLVLPKNEEQWLNLVNNFLADSSLNQEYFSPQINQNLVEQLDYCLNFNLDPEFN